LIVLHLKVEVSEKGARAQNKLDVIDAE